MAKNTLSLPLSKVKEVYKKYLYLENDIIIDIILACYVANQLDMDPLWMLVIAPPSTTKTEALRTSSAQAASRYKLGTPRVYSFGFRGSQCRRRWGRRQGRARVRALRANGGGSFHTHSRCTSGVA